MLLRRYVHGPGTDDPIVWYEGSGTTGRRFLHADERGSIVAVSDSSGAVLGINAYDEYGIPASTNLGAFGYTGQAWLSEIGVQYSKARLYSPTWGRFLQTDPIGYGGGMNMYAYVGNDPINEVDSLGLSTEGYEPNTICTGTRIESGCGEGGIADGLSGFSTAGVGGQYQTGTSADFGGGGYSVCVSSCNNPASGYSDSSGAIVVYAPPQYAYVPPSSGGLPYVAGTPNSRPNPLRPRPVADPADYCGSNELNVPEGNWGGACRVHDKCYATKGSAKAQCDIGLLGNILAECTESVWIPALCVAPAVWYWFGVAVGGGPAFRREQE